MPLRGLQVDSFRSLGAAFTELQMRTPEGKAKEKETREGGAQDDREGGRAQNRRYILRQKDL